MESRPRPLPSRSHGLPGLLNDEPPSLREQLVHDAKVAFANANTNTPTWRCCHWVLRCIAELCDDNEQNIDYWRRQLVFVTTPQPVKRVVGQKVVVVANESEAICTEMPMLGLWASQLTPYARQSFTELVNAAGNYDDSLRPASTPDRTTSGHRVTGSAPLY